MDLLGTLVIHAKFRRQPRRRPEKASLHPCIPALSCTLIRLSVVRPCWPSQTYSDTVSCSHAHYFLRPTQRGHQGHVNHIDCLPPFLPYLTAATLGTFSVRATSYCMCVHTRTCICLIQIPVSLLSRRTAFTISPYARRDDERSIEVRQQQDNTCTTCTLPS